MLHADLSLRAHYHYIFQKLLYILYKRHSYGFTRTVKGNIDVAKLFNLRMGNVNNTL